MVLKHTPITVLCRRLSCLLLGLAAGSIHAQSHQIPDDIPPSVLPDSQPKAQPAMTFGQVFASIQKAEPNRRAGLRASLLSQSMQVMPVVIIVETPSAYLDAIAGWEGQVRYPIFFDDGTDLSRENIARFVRAFKPEEVIRVSSEGQSSWGTTNEAHQNAIEKALAAATQENQPDWRASLKAIKDSGVVSPGVVVIDPMDRYWAGGLALAAGRFQPVIFLKGPRNFYKDLTPAIAESINESISQGLIRLDLDYDEIGDEVDAITLAFRAGIKVKTGPQDRDRVATTDRIGRDAAGGLRWAWCGQLYGTTSTSVYQAMCSLFLPMDSAFVWDGYPSTGDWGRYDGTKASEVLTEGGLTTELFDEPRNSLASFRGRGDSRPVEASLILMNTKGAPTYFDLPKSADGTGKPGDIPLLSIPSAMHIVHSFSLSRPHDQASVGARWLERGVYLYAGSVDEPYLSGFVPTPLVASRLLGKLPFASAVHYDDGQAWKIAVIGDPLKTISPCGNRLATSPDVVTAWAKSIGGEVLGEYAKEMLKASRYTDAIRDFVLTDRDDAVIRLAKALIADKPGAVDDLGAKIVIQAAMRQGEHELVLDAFERLSEESRSDIQTLDALWFAGRYRLTRMNDRRAMALMRTNLREHHRILDAEQLAMVMRGDSMSDAIAYLESLRSGILDRQRPLLDKVIARVRR